MKFKLKTSFKMKTFTSLLFVYCTFYHAFASLVITKFDVQGEPNGFGCDISDIVFLKENIVSLAHCASECSKNVQCVGFVYKPEVGHCVGCKALVHTSYNTSTLVFLKQQDLTPVTNSPSTSIIPTSTNSAFPEFLRRGDTCHNDSNCPQEFNLCLDGFCNCIAGYSYNPGTDSCVIGCETYGLTYIAHTGKDFNADIIFISNEMSALDCSTTCSNNSTCRGFSHSPTYDRNGWCSMQTSTPYNKPGHFFSSGNNFTYYIRNCN